MRMRGLIVFIEKNVSAKLQKKSATQVCARIADFLIHRIAFLESNLFQPLVNLGVVVLHAIVAFYKIFPHSNKKMYFCNLESCVMKNIVEISRTQVIMTFISTCVETTARSLNTSYREVYQRMKRVGLIERFILPNYETLHSESRENLAGVLVECLNNWENKK